MANREVVVRILGDADKLSAAFGDADKAAQTFSGKMQATGTKLTKTLTPAAIAVGAGFGKAFADVDGGLDAIRVGTGATGKALESLGDSMKNVGGKVTQPLAEVGTVLADVQTRTGLTGPPLERLTKQLLDLNRIGQDIGAEQATRVFGDWGIEAGKSTEAMDKLFRASQATGPSMSRLAELVVQFGAPMRLLGFEFEDATALLGKFEKEGVNTEAILGGMKIGLGKMAKAGEAPKETFTRLIGEIKGAATEGEALGIAAEAFGTRAGPDLAAAIREGRFELGDLLAQVSGGSETIAKASADTLDWSDKFAMLRNKIVGTVGPFGEVGMAAAGVAAGVGPVLVGLGKVGSGLSDVAGGAGRAAKSIGSSVASAATATASWAASSAKATGALIADVAKTAASFAANTAKAIASVVVAAAAHVVQWGIMAASALAGAAAVAAAWLISIAPIAIIIAAIAGVVALVIIHWDTIKRWTAAAWDFVVDKISTAWEWIKGAVSAGVDFLRNLFLNFTPLGLFIRHFDTLVGFVRGLPGRIANAASGLFDGLKDAFRSAINWIIRAWNRLEFRVPSIDLPLLGKVGGFTLGMPNIPQLATGGIVTGPTLAMLGEASRPEAVIPLDRYDFGGGVNMTNHFYAPIWSERELEDLIVRTIEGRFARGGSLTDGRGGTLAPSA